MNDHALVKKFYPRHELSNALTCELSNAFTIDCVRQPMSAVDFLVQRMIIRRDINPSASYSVTVSSSSKANLAC